jgi:hypothetical protein
MGMVWMGGAAIRARYRDRVQTKVMMQTISARYKSICARCKPTSQIALIMPA